MNKSKLQLCYSRAMQSRLSTCVSVPSDFSDLCVTRAAKRNQRQSTDIIRRIILLFVSLFVVCLSVNWELAAGCSEFSERRNSNNFAELSDVSSNVIQAAS